MVAVSPYANHNTRTVMNKRRGRVNRRGNRKWPGAAFPWGRGAIAPVGQRSLRRSAEYRLATGCRVVWVGLLKSEQILCRELI